MDNEYSLKWKKSATYNSSTGHKSSLSSKVNEIVSDTLFCVIVKKLCDRVKIWVYFVSDNNEPINQFNKY